MQTTAAATATATGGTVEDKEERPRREARALFQALCAKLDALSHFHFAPKPVVEELEVGGAAEVVSVERA